MIKIAVTKGRIEKEFLKLVEQTDLDASFVENKKRKLVIKTQDNIEMTFVRSNDVLKFIEQGTADLGIIGNDTLEENDFKNYIELLDLKIGKCFFALAGFKEYKKSTTPKRIATKYPNITKKYFKSIGEDVEIIKMEGSIEVAPIVGIADGIIDIVETGNTLQENGLTIIKKIFNVSTRVIANKSSLIYKEDDINIIIEKIKQVI